MRRMLNGAGFFFLAVIGMQPGTLVSSRSELLALDASQTKDAKVDVKVVKYDGLKETVTGFKGKSGRSFRAKLKIEQADDGKWRVDFDEDWAKPAEPAVPKAA